MGCCPAFLQPLAAGGRSKLQPDRRSVAAVLWAEDSPAVCHPEMVQQSLSQSAVNIVNIKVTQQSESLLAYLKRDFIITTSVVLNNN